MRALVGDDVDVARFNDAKQFKWAIRQKRRHGCFDDADVWKDPRVHPFFGTDASNMTTLRALPLPPAQDSSWLRLVLSTMMS